MVVVHEHVVMSAEQHSIGKVGRAASPELVDVVHLTPAGGPIAVGGEASAIAGGDRGALPAVMQSLRPTEVERLTVIVEEDRYEAAVARVALNGLDRDGGALPLDEADARAPVEVGEWLRARFEAALAALAR